MTQPDPRWWSLLACVVLLAMAGACRHQVPSPVEARYTVGGGYEAAGSWFYPREDFHYDATGLATVGGPGGVTADGERADGTAMTAAHQTLQLPCIVRVTNLETGMQVRVRVNDRGPATPSRLIALSPRAAALAGVVPGGTRVRVEVEEGPSQALRDRLGGGPRLAIVAAPRSAVTAEALPPPPGVGQSTRGRDAGVTRVADTSGPATADAVPDRLPETAVQGAPRPGLLLIRAGTFGQMTYAQQVSARLSALGAHVERVREGRSERFTVEAGPFATVAAADAALDQALRAGVSDARIVVE